MNSKIVHRGPDAGRVFEQGNFVFGHRRLAIIDLNARSDQPMQFNNLTIVFNGEIYNFESIRADLEACGYKFSSAGDCEVVLKAYSEWGAGCVARFKGMWAFAISDQETGTLFCSRDRFGIKPFYYMHDEKNFYFGSEIKQLIGRQNKPSMAAVVDYLAGGYVDHTAGTFFEGIYQLPPASNLSIELQDFQTNIQQYFVLGEELVRGEDPGSLLDRSIGEHLISDVPIGSCLSGGLDSSYINYRLAERRPNSIAIHSDTGSKGLSERDKAELVSARCGLKLEVVTPERAAFENEIATLMYAQEQPFGDPSVYMQFCVMKRASEAGIKVMLDGQGADEVFMGYSKYLGMRMWAECSPLRLVSFVRLATLSVRNNSISIFGLLAFMLGTKFEKLRRFVQLLAVRLPLKYWKGYLQRGDSQRDPSDFHRHELYSYPLPTLLRNEDRNSMFFSIEARVPYLDHELVCKTFSQDIETHVADGWTKTLLREAAKGKLPDEIIYRKDKLGFNSPESWLKGISYEPILSSRLLMSIFGSRLNQKFVASIGEKARWRLFSVAIWESVFNIDAD